MSDYRYGDVISMQEAAIRRVNEMQRRAREAARLANEELAAGGKVNIQRSAEKSFSHPAENTGRQASHTNLPVDYLHGGGYPVGYSVGYPPQNGNNNFGNAPSEFKEKEGENFHNSSHSGGNNHQETQRAQNTQHNNSNRKNNEGEKNNKASTAGNQKPTHNSWAQAAVNRQQKQTLQTPSRREGGITQRQGASHNIQKNNHQQPFSFGENGIFSALGGVIGNMDNDTILLLGLLYILWRDGADYGLLFALFYILM